MPSRRILSKREKSLQVYWQGERFDRLRQYFTTNEILQARLNKIAFSNKRMRSLINGRKRDIRRIGIIHPNMPREDIIEFLYNQKRRELRQKGLTIADVLDEIYV